MFVELHPSRGPPTPSTYAIADARAYHHALEAYAKDRTFPCPVPDVKLAVAGVRFAISAGDGGAEVRDLPHIAGMAAAYGLSPEDALRSVTLWPAQIFGVADRFGSLEVGKTANLVVVDGDVLEARTNTRYLFIDGRAEMKESGPVPRGAWAAVHNCENCPRCQKLTAARLGRCADCILFSHDHVGRPVAESKQGCV